MKMEAETGFMLLQARGHMEPPEAGRGKKDFPSSLWRGYGLASRFQTTDL